MACVIVIFFEKVNREGLRGGRGLFFKIVKVCSFDSEVWVFLFNNCICFILCTCGRAGNKLTGLFAISGYSGKASGGIFGDF